MKIRIVLTVFAMLIGQLSPSAWAAEAVTEEIWLRQGAGVSVSASAGGESVIFGLVGRIWALDPVNGFATQLSDDEEFAGHPVLSADGTLIAYETVRNGYHQIIVRDADGGSPRQITFGDFEHRTPGWSQSGAARRFDGRRLIMSSNRGGRFGVWEVDIDTLELQQLTFANSDEFEPAWNEDGTSLAYVTETPNGTALYSVTLGERPVLLTEEAALIRSPAWRPGGGVLTYVRQLNGTNQLRMVLLSEPTVTKSITDGENVFPYPAEWLSRSQFLYSADGQIRRRDFGGRNAETVSFNARLEIATERWSRRPLTLAANDNQPVNGNNGLSVAADGSYIVATLGDLWEVRPGGEPLRQLTNDPYVEAHPALSPDGTTVAFVSDRGGSLQVWLTDLKTMQSRPLTREFGVALYPQWADSGAAIEYVAAAHSATPSVVGRRIDIETGNVETIDNAGNGSAAPAPGVADDIPLTWRPYAASGRKIIRAGRVFDGTGPNYLTKYEIVIEGDRIAAVRPWTDDDTDDDTEIIDARERTVIPGLIDVSVRQSRLADERLGRKFLAYGVTTIREAVDNPAEALERSESWNSGRRAGPRLLLTSTPCGDAPGGFVVRPVLEPTVAQRSFRARINEAIDHGSVSIGVCPSLNTSARVDVIATVHASGLPARTGEAFPDILLGADETRVPPPGQAGYEAFASVTGQLGLTVTSNLAPTGLPGLIDDGELTGGWQYRELFTRAEQGWYEDTWTLSTAALASLGVQTRAMSRSLSGAIAQGARVVTGSDAPAVPPGLGLHAELRLLTRAGLKPYQALQMATRDAGRAVGGNEQLGVIRPGALADMVIVDGDPLADVRDTANVRITITRGQPYTRRELTSPGNRPAGVGNLYN